MTTIQQSIALQIRIARRYLAAIATGALELARAALRVIVRLEAATGLRTMSALAVARG